MIRIFCLFLLLFAACQKRSEVAPQTLRVNFESDPQTLDPRKARDVKTVALMHMLFEGLTRLSVAGKTELALAEAVEISDDLTRYVFHLRKSFWSNGEPVTSADFAESWKSILDPAFPTDIASQLYPIKQARQAKLGKADPAQIGIRTPDSQTLIVELEAPMPYFLELTSMTSFFPVPQNRDPSWALDPSAHVGNGPFSLQSWARGDRIRIVKNPRYWEAAQVKVGAIDLFMVEADTEMRMFEKGELDWAGSPLSSVPSDFLADLKAKGLLCSSPLSGTLFFRVNTMAGPLANASFRKALAYALDRETVAQHVLQGGQQPAMELVPPEMGLSERGYFLDGAREAAQALLGKALEELHLEKGSLKPLVISYRSSQRNNSLVQALQKQLEGVLGLQVELEAVEPKIFFRRLSQKEFQMVLSDWIADFDDPINFLDVFKYKDASTNCTHWESGNYIDLLNRSDLCGDEKERKRLLRAAEEILMDEMPIIPLFHCVFNYLQSGALQNVALSPIGQIDFRWAERRESPL